jgi:predicted outer membrane repeat protein
MKRYSIPLVGLLISLSTPVAHAQGIRYVDDDAAPGGDGLGWTTAYHDLQDALDEARLSAGLISEIRIGGGTYLPDRGVGDISLRFELVDGVWTRGGFAGLAGVDPDVQDPTLHPTILSVDLAGDDLPDDPYGLAPGNWGENSNSSLGAPNVGPGTVLDSITVQHTSTQFFAVNFFNCRLTVRDCRFIGNAAIAIFGGSEVTFENCDFDGHLDGKAATIQQSMATFIDCHFNDCHGTWGVALDIWQSDVTFERVQFTNNWLIVTAPDGFDTTFVAQNGGAFRAHSGSSVTAIDCLFDNNLAIDGGAIYFDESDLVLERCEFTNNEASTGGGIRGTVSSGGQFDLTDCAFRNNVANGFSLGWGGAFYVFSLDATGHDIIGCTFADNSSRSAGGAVRTQGSRFRYQDCRFERNVVGTSGSVDRSGGAIASVDGIDLVGCDFVSNTGGQGGAVQVNRGDLIVTDSSFVDNVAATFAGGPNTPGGGAVFYGDLGFDMPSLRFERCFFAGNHTAGDGGALALQLNRGAVDLLNSAFSANTSVQQGGAAFIRHATTTDIINSTFGHNAAGAGGGAIYTFGREPSGVTQLNAVNSVFWGNTDDGLDGTSQIDLGDRASIALNNSLISDVAHLATGLSNINADPLFDDVDGADNLPGTADDSLRLSATSAAINAGDNAITTAAGLTLDLDGEARIVGGVVDMGAYENRTGTCAADADGSGEVGINDFLLVLSQWGPCPTPCLADLDNDGTVGVTDFLFLLASWGPCP